MRKSRTSTGVTRVGKKILRDNVTKCYALGEIRLELPERESYAIDWYNFGGEMIPWTTMLVRQVVCYSETSTCEVLNKKNSDGEQNRFQSVLAVV